MLEFLFTQKAEKEWERLDIGVQKSLAKKIQELKNPDLFESHIKPVIDLLPATHRIRIGYYRCLIKREGAMITILSIGHRREIYK